MKGIFYILACPILLLSALAGYTQTNEHLNIERHGFRRVIPDQLTKGAFDLLIDKKGFIWIGHEYGLLRYDGTNVIHYNHPEQSSLATGNLLEDQYDRIWCRNFNGQVFYIQDEEMHLLKTANPEISFKKIALLNNEMILVYDKGMIIYNPDTREEKNIHTLPGNLNLVLSTDIYTSDSFAYFLCHANNTKYIFKYQHGKLHAYTSSTEEPEAYNIISAGTDHVLVKCGRSNTRLVLYSIKNNTISRQKEQAIHVKSVFLNASKNGDDIWIHTSKMSIMLNGNDTIRDLSLTKYEEDDDGNIWALSTLHGLLFKKKKHSWTLHPVNPEKGHAILLDTFHQKIVSVSHKGFLTITDIHYPDQQKTIPLHIEHAVGLIRDGDALLVYNHNTILTIDKNFKIVNRKIFSQAFKDATILDDYYVFGTYTGLFAMPRKEQYKSLTNNIITAHFGYDDYQQAYTNRQGKRTRTVAYLPSKKKLYAGLSHGLFTYTATHSEEIRLHNAPIFAYSIRTYKNQVYVSTMNNGILILQDSLPIRKIHQQDGLLSATVIKLKIFNDHLWVLGTDNIQLYDLKEGSFKHNLLLPPIKGTQVYDLMELDNKIYLSTIEGIYEIPLKKNEPSKKAALPKNYLNSVMANMIDTIKDGSVLPWKKNNLQFNLTGIYYYDQERLFFTYRLLGQNNDTTWNICPPGQNKVQLAYLAPGKYQFEARAHIPDGLTSANPIVFTFTISKPWWKSFWFTGTVFICTCFTGFIIIRIRVHARKKAHRKAIEKLEYEKALNESEMKALRSQMNPHFIFNSLNTIQEMFMWGDKNEANEQMANFASLTRLILTVSEKKSVPLSTETELLKKYLEVEKMRFQGAFNYEIIIDAEIDEGYIHIPPMIIQPFVENSIKHGLLHKQGEKNLSITFEFGPGHEYIGCVIRDNGVGRKRAAELREASGYNYSSFSTEATTKRLQLVNKNINNEILISYTDLKDETGTPTGTSVRIMIPTFV